MNELENSKTSGYLTSLLVPTILIVLGIIIYPIAYGKMYLSTDLIAFHLPFRIFYQHCLQENLNFAWMPDIFCGFYALGEGQTGMYHPLHWLLYRFLPINWAFGVEFVYSYPLMLVGFYLLLRRWQLSAAPSLYGALTFTFSAFCLLHGMHTNMLQIVAHMPCLMLAIDHLLSPEQRPADWRRWWVVLALLTASQLLLGHPQSVYLSSFAECCYMLILMFDRKLFPLLSRILIIFSAKILACFLAAIQLLPSYEFLLESERATTTEAFRMTFSLHPINLVQFLGPHFFTNHISTSIKGIERINAHELGLYCGATATLLMLWVAYRFLRGENIPAPKLAFGGLMLLVFSLLISFGKYGTVYQWVSALPVLNAFRCPSRHILLVETAIAFLAAVGFADLMQRIHSGERLPWKQSWFLFIPAVAGWVLAAYLLGVKHLDFPISDYYKLLLPKPPAVWTSPTIMTAATLLFIAATRGNRTALAALVIFSAMELSFQGIPFLRDKTPPMTMDEYRETLLPAPPTQDGARVNAYSSNLFSLRGIDNFSGYIGPFLKREFNRNIQNNKVFRLANVRWNSNRTTDIKKLQWSEVQNPLPYARLLTQVRESKNTLADLEKIDIATTALVRDPLVLPEGTPGVARLIHKKPGDIMVQTTSASRQLLVLSESWHSGWKVRVDGKTMPVLKVNGDFQGCLVDPGVHDVVFTFAPWSLTAGKSISLFSLGILLLVCLWGRIPFPVKKPGGVISTD